MWENAAPLPENESPRPPAGCVKSEEDLVLWAQILLCLAAIGLVPVSYTHLTLPTKA